VNILSENPPPPTEAKAPETEHSEAKATLPVENKPKRPMTPLEDLPKHPVLVLKMTKAGSITLPKEIREKLEENVAFAFWETGNKLIFQIIAEEDVINLEQADKKKSDETASSAPKKERKKSAEGGAKKSTQKQATGPQPELAKYFPYDFENKDKVSAIFESSFFKFVEEPPNIEEALNRLRYALVNYVTGKSMNDSRLRNAMINMLCDVSEKTKLTQPMDFAQEKILDFITSDFLLEQSLNTLILTTGHIGNFNNSEAFLKRILKHVDKYKDNELYAIKQLFTNLIRAIIRDKIELPRNQKLMIRDKLQQFITGYSNVQTDPNIPPIEHKPVPTDTAIEFIEMIEKLKLIEEAHQMATNLLKGLPPEDKDIEKVRATIHRLDGKPI
jgi:bifunctional DNA-binding transcriptional regulator/antitoxin component of YhaV-PrlF toxin-antitoxin module